MTKVWRVQFDQVWQNSINKFGGINSGKFLSANSSYIYISFKVDRIGEFVKLWSLQTFIVYSNCVYLSQIANELSARGCIKTMNIKLLLQIVSYPVEA